MVARTPVNPIAAIIVANKKLALKNYEYEHHDASMSTSTVPQRQDRWVRTPSSKLCPHGLALAHTPSENIMACWANIKCRRTD